MKYAVYKLNVVCIALCIGLWSNTTPSLSLHSNYFFSFFCFFFFHPTRTQDVVKEHKQDMALKITSNPGKPEEDAPQPES